MSIREMYVKYGVRGYYENHGYEYSNPHAADVCALLDTLLDKKIESGIDFSCGDGLVSSHLPHIKWTGVDPYLNQRYTKNTGNKCIQASMEDVSKNSVLLPLVDVIVCSYCFDIFQNSYMKTFLWNLSLLSDKLIVIRSNKKIIDSICWEINDYEVRGKSHMTIYNAIKDLK